MELPYYARRIKGQKSGLYLDGLGDQPNDTHSATMRGLTPPRAVIDVHGQETEMPNTNSGEYFVWVKMPLGVSPTMASPFNSSS